MSPLTYFKFP